MSETKPIGGWLLAIALFLVLVGGLYGINWFTGGVGPSQWTILAIGCVIFGSELLDKRFKNPLVKYAMLLAIVAIVYTVGTLVIT